MSRTITWIERGTTHDHLGELVKGPARIETTTRQAQDGTTKTDHHVYSWRLEKDAPMGWASRNEGAL